MIYYKDFDFETLTKYRCNKRWKKTKRKACYYINAPFSFDIETTTLELSRGYRAFMYVWSFGIDGTGVFGRTWSEFRDFLTKFKNALKLCSKQQAIVFVHNLGFEIEFLHSQIKISNVFARSTHNPIFFDAEDYFLEFRDSYILSGLRLEKTAENLTKHKIEKLDGDKFDYSKIRHFATELKSYELEYCEHDVIILNYYIQEEIEYNGNDITKIPLTRTGYARRRFRQAMKKDREFWKEWKQKLNRTYPTKEQYILMNKCFTGGFVHGNCNFVTLALEDVTSIDICSSYPAQMVARKYPLGRWIEIDTKTITNREIFNNYIQNNACMFDIAFKNIRAKTPHHIISRSKCAALLNPIVDNGRIVSADVLQTYMTDIDYKTICKFYEFDNIMINQMYITSYEYLPKPFVEEVLNLFEIKTKLKDVIGKEEEYMRGKGDLNAGYGMLCTDVVSPEIFFECGQWEVQKSADIDIQKQLDNNKKSNGYFMPYAVGVWVTAYARFALLSMLYEIDKNDPIGDAIYCDTDSIKMINYKNHIKAIEKYNKQIISDVEKALSYHDIDSERARPKTIKGKTKQLGVFELDAHYQLFKTLGSKRYCYINNDKEFHYTASGIPKDKPKLYIEKQAEKNGKHPFDIFVTGLTIPCDWSDKLTHQCFNDECKVNVTDYQENTQIVDISSCCVLIPQPYKMQLSTEFLQFLTNNISIPLNSKQPLGYKQMLPELAITSYD